MSRWRFSLVEQRIEQLVEGGFARLFADRLSPRDVAVRLARAMEDAAITDTDGSLLAPNTFSVFLNADDYALMDAHLAENLSETVVDFAHRTEMRLLTAPYVTVIAAEDVPSRTVRVEASHQRSDPHETQATSPVTVPDPPPPVLEKSPRNPQLIVNGTQYIPLSRHVINIGRRFDNHIVLDDPRVSRTHAQLRLRFGHYVLFDLGSRGGTLVNDHQVTEYVLKSGDVISLAGVMLVYVEDETNPKVSTKTDTQIRRPHSRPESDDSPTL
jgi:hypothetical protein